MEIKSAAPDTGKLLARQKPRIGCCYEPCHHKEVAWEFVKLLLLLFGCNSLSHSGNAGLPLLRIQSPYFIHSFMHFDRIILLFHHDHYQDITRLQPRTPTKWPSSFSVCSHLVNPLRSQGALLCHGCTVRCLGMRLQYTSGAWEWDYSILHVRTRIGKV